MKSWLRISKNDDEEHGETNSYRAKSTKSDILFVNFLRFNEFDHKFFGISDSEVEQMDPQQKQLLQCVYRALENAGIPMEKANGTRTGVFFG